MQARLEVLPFISDQYVKFSLKFALETPYYLGCCLPPTWREIWEFNCGRLRHARKVHKVRGVPDYTSKENVGGRMF